MTSTSRGSIRRVVALWSAVLAANVAVLSTGPISFNHLLQGLLPSDQANTWYSITAAAGALTSAIGYLFFGRLSDSLLIRFGSRKMMFAIPSAVFVAAGFTLANAHNHVVLLITWVVIQTAGSAILSAATTVALETSEKTSVGVASGLFGASAVLAIFFGAALNTFGRLEVPVSLGICLVTAAVLCVPAVLINESLQIAPAKAVKHKFKLTKPLASFLFAVFAIGSALALSTDYYYQVAVKLLGQNQQAVDLSALLLSVAAFAFLTSTVCTGWLFGATKRSAIVFLLSLVVTAVGILLIGFGGEPSLVVAGAVVVGLAAGSNVGTQFQILKLAVSRDDFVGSEVGSYNLVAVLPNFALPLIAAVAMTINKATWTQSVATFVAILCIIAATQTRTK